MYPLPSFRPRGTSRRLHDYSPSGTSGKAIASLVLGICSFVACIFSGIPAILLGILGLRDIDDPRKNVGGRGMAIAGIVLGAISCLWVPVMMALLLPAVQAAREAARRAQCTNNLKQIALGMHNYASVYGCFPPAATYDADGKPLVSWRVLILPYVESNPLYNQFHVNEPWDSPNNKPLGDHAPAVFRCPSEGNMMEGYTTYKVIVDLHSMFTGKPSGVPFEFVSDGTSNTLAVVEGTTPVPWSKPDDLSLASSEPMLGIGSKHPGGSNVSLADGSVQFLRNSSGNPLSLQVLKALITRDGHEAVPPPW